MTVIKDKTIYKRLENAIRNNDFPAIRQMCEMCNSFEFTPKLLGIALRKTSLETIQFLLAKDFKFSYTYSPSLKRKYDCAYTTASGKSYPCSYLLMILKNINPAYISILSTDANSYHFGSEKPGDFTDDVQANRINIVDTLCKKLGQSAKSELLYYSILWQDDEIATHLLNKGCQIQGYYKDLLITNNRKTLHKYNRTHFPEIDRVEMIDTILSYDSDSIIKVISEFEKAINDKVLLAPKLMEYNALDEKMLWAIISKTNLDCFTQTDILKKAVLLNSIRTLDYFANKQWLKDNDRRNQLITFAQNSNCVESVSFLIDYISQNVDVLAEEENKRKKEEKSLMSDPNSATEMKKTWKWEMLEDDSLCITGYRGNGTKAIVPGIIGNKKVIRTKDTFYALNSRCKGESRILEKIIVSEGIEMIGSSTFRDCKLVKEIILPSSLLKIGSKAFYGCTSLTEIVIPKSVKSIAKDAMVTSYGQQTTVVADEGSYAAKYALKNGIAYKSGKI